MRLHSLDELIRADHPVRAVWQYVCSLDLVAFYQDIQAVRGGAGRDAVDPRILLTLWIFATLEGVGSARHLALRQNKDPYARQRGDTEEYFAFRQRMKTQEAKEIYKQRSATAEFPNAGCRNRGLHQFIVRGLDKVRIIAVWQALAHNLLRILYEGWLASSSRVEPVARHHPVPSTATFGRSQAPQSCPE